MNKLFTLVLICLTSFSWTFSTSTENDHIEAFFQQLTAHGGTWEATMPTTEDAVFTKFIMQFSADGPYSVRGTIQGVKTSGDTTHIWDIWEFPDPSRQNTTVMIQRSDWAYGIGSSKFLSDQKREGKLELTYYNTARQKHRDTHELVAPDKLVSESADFNAESGEWEPGTQLSWIRK